MTAAIIAAMAATSAAARDTERARAVRLVGFDVDGVLTDAGVYLAGDGTELKRFDIQDGLGIKLLQQAGLEVVFVSARHSEASAVRARELKVALHQGNGMPKRALVQKLLDERQLGWEHLAFVGDDLVDIPIFQRCGIAAAPANAVAEAKAAAHLVLEAAGGHGAVRAFIEWLLRQRGEWDGVVHEFLARAEAAS
jgi:3-deoxy-D-manno-octulosonate 8-phosphate phosphatase (KDO 8-P phosphatase)